MSTRRMPVMLSIAGSDSGGGAGIQADQRAALDHGVHPTTAITAVTAQHTAAVLRADPLPPEAVVAQIDAVLSDLTVGAIKIGLLGSVAVAEAVADRLAAPDVTVPVVVDPVLVATSGDELAEARVEAVLRDHWPALSALLTPNLPEAARLARCDPADRDALRAWARAQPCPVLLTGGDAEGDVVVDELLGAAEGDRVWRSPRLPGGPFHGTGCTLSSAVASRLARGESLHTAIGGAIAYVRDRLAMAVRLGAGAAVGGFVSRR